MADGEFQSATKLAYRAEHRVGHPGATGGKFDGAFGVLAALEAATRLAEAGITPGRDVVVVAWMNEEGSRFAPGMMGSEAFRRGVHSRRYLRAQDMCGTTVREALRVLHDSVPEVPRRALGFQPAAYLEAHIERGPLLEVAGVPIGIVTGIQGKTTWEVPLDGIVGHAGTLDMAGRRDAVAALGCVSIWLPVSSGGSVRSRPGNVRNRLPTGSVDGSMPISLPHPISMRQAAISPGDSA